jgi:hypothetical protein
MTKIWTVGTQFSFRKPAATAFCLFTAISSSIYGLGQAPVGVSASGVLSQMESAFSNGVAVQQIQLSGTATWTAGSLEDSGTATLTASSTGPSRLQLLLSSTGSRTETQTGFGSSADCQWAGADGVAHEVSVGNCWKPALWFLPGFSFQPSLIPNSVGLVDLGTGVVGASQNTYRHLQGQILSTGLPSSIASSVTQQSTTDIGLDPTSLLPAVLAYSVIPDRGATTPIAIEIHYSNYQTVNGVQIPFLIQRYVNGSLQLSIAVSSAQIN